MPRNINPLIPVEDDLLKILSEDEVKDFKAMREELQDTWKKKQIFRTETEMRISVLDDLKHPTPAAKYWQAVREQNVFFEQIIFLSFDYRKCQIEVKKIERDLKEEKDDLEKELLLVKLDEKKFALADMLLTAKDRMRELRLWSKIKSELKESDPNFDDKNVNTHQQQALPIRLAQTMRFFDKANDADGAKNIMSQLVTAERLIKEGKMPPIKTNQQIKNDKTDK
tara:strand:- start:7452 stop:8126 length:675 start_codon:yes stop_codon:yes gene_type:complete